MYTILIIDDEVDIQKKYAEALEQRVTIIPVHSLPELNRAWENYSSTVALVVVDGQLSLRSKSVDMNLHVQWMRETFKGPMIAASSSDKFRLELMQNGCSHQCPKEKVPALVLELLALP
jgi:DNA-binding NtrC family response regulator